MPGLVSGVAQARADLLLAMTSFTWNREDSRAFVPTLALLNSPDVLPSSVAGVIDSRSPFSVGVYSVDEELSQFRALKLLYVSDEVVRDRARSSPPMPAGWYLPIEKGRDMGKAFEVRVTTRGTKLVEALRREVPGDNVAIQYIKVDGHKAIPGGSALDLTIPCPNRCQRYRGFTESTTERSVTSGYQNLRSFCFSKPEVAENEGDANVGDTHDFGKIELEMESACKGPPRTRAASPIAKAVPHCAPVTERSVMKKGATVALKQDGKAISERANLTTYTVHSQKSAPSLGIRIHVRERNWLMSRRIVNSDGRPCTAAMAQAMEDVNTSRVPRRPMKKVKTDPGEVVDLS